MTTHRRLVEEISRNMGFDTAGTWRIYEAGKKLKSLGGIIAKLYYAPTT